MRSDCEGIHVFHVLAQLLSAAVREFVAVGLLLALSLRADGYDFFNSGLILFLVLIVVRLPFINSYSFLFETLTTRSWGMKHVGVQSQDRSGYNLIHAVVIVVAHVYAAIAAAGFRIYYEVSFGTESMGLLPKINPQLTVDTRVLEKMGTEWAANERLGRLGLLDGTKTFYLPLNSTLGHGIDKTALLAWYVGEDAAYVCLLCVCFLHIWIATGVLKEKDDSNATIPLNPFRPRYWQQLFRTSALLTMVQLALSRAFPTAHGSLHATVFRLQYQAWRPDANVLDNENNEAAARIIGGLAGMMLAGFYSWMLVSTKNFPKDTFYFSLIWGMESPYAKEEKKRGGYASYQRVESSSVDEDEKNPSGFRSEMEAGVDPVRKTDFKLRLPFTLNHNK
jgi:hypothetical protein